MNIVISNQSGVPIYEQIKAAILTGELSENAPLPSLRLLDNISFSVPCGFVGGFIGENGAGKTTTLKLILGMVMKDGGDIKLFGKPAEDVSLKEDVGVLFEQPGRHR